MKSKTITLLGLFATITIIALFGVYYYQFQDLSISANHSDWATFGTYIGGVSGAILSFITIWLLVKSLNSQNKHSTISQFEASFFELMRLHKDITSAIKGTISFKSEEGRFSSDNYQGLEYIEMISRTIDVAMDRDFEDLVASLNEEYLEYKMKNIETIQADIDKMYDNVYKGKETTLGHYFRSLHHLVKFVDMSSVDEKQKYADLIQAYLTDSELHIVFYNAIARHGRERFLPLLDKYHLLENIDSKGLFFDKHFETFYPKTYPKFRDKQKHKEMYN